MTPSARNARLMTMHTPRIRMLLAAALIAAGCAGPSRLSMDDIRNAPFTLSDAGTIRFTDGAFDRAAADTHGLGPLRVGQIDLAVFGDLDGDGTEDAATFLSIAKGGPEIFLTMEGFLNDGGTPVHAGSYLLGDRIAIDSVTIEGGEVELHLIVQGPDDAPCCPTMHVRRKVRYADGAFRELPWP